jgi:hypothetical protein
MLYPQQSPPTDNKRQGRRARNVKHFARQNEVETHSQSKNVEKPTFQEMSISAIFASEWGIGCKEGESRIKAAD